MKKLSLLLIGLLALTLFQSCSDDEEPTISLDTPTDNPTAAELLLSSIRTDGGTPYDANNPALSFTDNQNVFVPSVLGIDFRIDRSVVPAGPTVRLPMFQGWESLPDGSVREGFYVITEASDQELARELGVIFAPRMANAIGSGGESQARWSEDGRLIFEGWVDFSPTRSLIAGDFEDELFGFPPEVANPGAIASDDWSSYVVLPDSDIVINAQMVANSTGIHDRIPNPNGISQADEDDLNLSLIHI